MIMCQLSGDKTPLRLNRQLVANQSLISRPLFHNLLATIETLLRPKSVASFVHVQKTARES